MVVICHNNTAEIDRCLERVLDLGCSVTLVDTASTDGSAAHVRAHYPTVHLVELTENRGFGSAANDGVESDGNALRPAAQRRRLAGAGGSRSRSWRRPTELPLSARSGLG